MATPYSPSQYDPATATWAPSYVAPATASIPGTGSQPDYGALALDSPIYQSWLTGANAKIGKAGDARRAAAQFAALNYGGLPPGFQDAYGDLTPDVLAQAQDNPQSTIHRLQQNYDAAQQSMQQGLAARGALHSGDLVFGQQNLDTGFAANQSDAATAFGQAMTGAGGTYDQYTGQVSDALSGRSGALTDAITALEQDPTHQPGPDTAATLLPNWQADYGRPMYTGPDGKLWTPDPATGALTLYATPTTDPTQPGYTYSGF